MVTMDEAQMIIIDFSAKEICIEDYEEFIETVKSLRPSIRILELRVE